MLARPEYLHQSPLAGITTVAAANRWLAENYWPAHNAAFAVAPAEARSAFVADRTGRVRDILCIREERRVGNDNTVKWRGLSLQIPPNPLRAHFVRATVRVHEYPDGRLAIFHGPHRRPTTTPREPRAMTPSWLREPLRSWPVDLWTTLRVAHNPTGATTSEAVN